MPILLLALLTNLALGSQRNTIPDYPCYRTVEGTFALAQALAEKYPNLATWIDIGDSWEKTAGEGGWDLMVLKVTNRFIPGPKPKLFATSSIHAREYATAELMLRFAESLVLGHGNDPDITWMLDYQEAHFLFIMNPDGRKKAEPQVMWRKNTNRAYCGTNSSDRGVDLNRNFDFQWGSAGEAGQCSETYRGPKAGSEPEVQAVQKYLRKLFPDKNANPGDPVSLDYEGIYLDIHSYGEIIYQALGTPNNKGLTSLNRKFAYFNGYKPILSQEDEEKESRESERSDREFHGSRNTTYEFGYGDLGVPSYLIELGTAFFQSCSFFEKSILPGNLKALDYAMRVLKAPYKLPAGPEVTELQVSQEATTLSISAKLDDTRFSTNAGTETTQAIAAAELYLHTPPWVEGAEPIPAKATDGKFDSKQESVTATLDTTGLNPGRHIFYFRGKDAAGDWGPVRAGFFHR